MGTLDLKAMRIFFYSTQRFLRCHIDTFLLILPFHNSTGNLTHLRRIYKIIVKDIFSGATNGVYCMMVIDIS
jgi:hypothetical protein